MARVYIRYSHFPGQVQRNYDRTKPHIFRLRAHSDAQATKLCADRVWAKNGGPGIVSAQRIRR